MQIRYFAWLRQRMGTSSETLDMPDGVRTVRDLATLLAERHPAFAEAYKAKGALRIAVNQEYVNEDIALGPEDEVAFFPPVTGG